MDQPIIAIDARRKINSGIGRVSQWLASNAAELIGPCSSVYLVSSADTRGYEFGAGEVIVTDIKPFSFDETYKLPELIASTGASLYLNPQTTWCPFNCVRSLNIIHDLWAITNPDWLPTAGDLQARFSIDNVGYFESLSKWFTPRKRRHLLTTHGAKLFAKLCDVNNPISLGIWAQYAATVEYSAQVITVSSHIHDLLAEVFPRGEEAIVIPNVPKDFFGGIRPQPKPEHFLVLSKLERRKNLLFLLDAYVEYCEIAGPYACPLVIAGDPGYQSVAAEILARIEDIRRSGHQVSVLASVSDDELCSLLMRAVALVFPTHFEGFGLPPLEAMLAGVPVIGTKTGMLNSPLAAHVVLIDPADRRKLVDALVNAVGPHDHDALVAARRDVLQLCAAVDAKALWKQAVTRALVGQG